VLEITIDVCTQRTVDESQERTVEAMGDALGRLHHALSNEVAWLYLKWREYVELFGTRPSRIDLLNQAASGFFQVVQDGLWEVILLHIARLTDKPRSAGRANLTICALPPLITKAEVLPVVEGMIKNAIANAEFARDWRNRHIAHRDLALALKDGAEPLMPASRAAVNDALASISQVLNSVSESYLGETTAYEMTENLHGAGSLLYVLDDGLRAEHARRERLKTGTYSSDDYAPRDF
jgi:AbiU2